METYISKIFYITFTHIKSLNSVCVLHLYHISIWPTTYHVPNN